VGGLGADFSGYTYSLTHWLDWKHVVRNPSGEWRAGGRGAVVVCGCCGCCGSEDSTLSIASLHLPVFWLLLVMAKQSWHALRDESSESESPASFPSHGKVRCLGERAWILRSFSSFLLLSASRLIMNARGHVRVRRG
jgi:hypothetical protein